MNTGAPWMPSEVAEQRVLHLQRKLHKWASKDKDKRFCDLWNLVHDPATLQVAWSRVRGNKGSRTAGIDAFTRYRVEHRYGTDRFLTELRCSLKDGSFRPLPVRQRSIPKKGGKVRYLGIPTLADRVVQMALKLVLEPILEAEFYASSYGYRPGRRAQDAIAEIYHFTQAPSLYEWVIEADIEACFDNIDHVALMRRVERRIGDRRVLRLIRAFLRSGVMTEAGRLERTITGTPQGGIISPLLANVALSELDEEFERRWEAMSTPYPGMRQTLRRKGFPTYRLIRFADDFVIVVKGTRAQATAIMAELPQIVGRVGLGISAEKTKLTHIDAGFEFLGFAIRRKLRNGKPCVYTFVSDEALASVKRKVKALTSRSTTNLSLHQLIRALNPVLRGWAAYFRFAAAKRTFAYLGYYAWRRVHLWLRKKHKGMGWKAIRRRYRLPGQFEEKGMVLYNPATMAIIRYRYRGSKISTRFNEVDPQTRGHRLMVFDETEMLGRVQQSLVVR